MKRTKKATLETVILTVKGKLLDRRSFSAKRDADTYKRASRAWATKNGIVVEVWSVHGHADMTSPARPGLIAQAG